MAPKARHLEGFLKRLEISVSKVCFLFFFLFLFLFFLFVCFCFFFLSFPAAYGGSQARGRIRAEAASLPQSHSSVGSEPFLQPIPQLRATPDP